VEEEEKKKRYEAMLKALGVPESLDRSFLYACLEYCKEGAEGLASVSPEIAKMGLNPASLALYIANEHAFYLASHPKLSQSEIIADESYIPTIASIAMDKYFTNEHLAYRLGSFTNRFAAPSSTMDLYLNFILGMLSHYKQGDPEETLVVDIMNKGFQMAKCVSLLLESGFETEAFSTWRTLHENECILHVIVKYGEPVIKRYIRHLTYAVAFRNGLKTKEETDNIFLEIKEGMHEVGLKSKDMKRYIEYGWLLGVKDVMKIEDFKFNFRDGVERVAGLSSYAKVYEMSSEIAHSSPLLIYSRKNYFYLVATLNLYESFFRLEKIFSSLYMSSVGEEQKQAYVHMRKLYYEELIACYNLEKQAFLNLNAKKEKDA
jgi:hypothetical protein